MNDLNHFFINRKITRGKLRRFLQEYRSDGYTLDVGCGEKQYEDLFPNAIYVDIDKKRNPDIIADIHDMNQFKDDTFDCIVCTEVLEHCHSPWKVADEMLRILKPGGVLLLSTRFIFPIHDTPCDYYRFTKYGLLHLFKDYQLVEIKEEATLVETIGILFQRLAFQTHTENPFIRLRWFLTAELCSKKDTDYLQYGNLRHEGKPERIITSGYYLALKKPVKKVEKE